MIDPTRLGVIHEAAMDIEVTGDVHRTCVELRQRLAIEELRCALRLAALDIDDERRHLLE